MRVGDLCRVRTISTNGNLVEWGAWDGQLCIRMFVSKDSPGERLCLLQREHSTLNGFVVTMDDGSTSWFSEAELELLT